MIQKRVENALKGGKIFLLTFRERADSRDPRGFGSSCDLGRPPEVAWYLPDETPEEL